MNTETNIVSCILGFVALAAEQYQLVSQQNLQEDEEGEQRVGRVVKKSNDELFRKWLACTVHEGLWQKQKLPHLEALMLTKSLVFAGFEARAFSSV